MSNFHGIQNPQLVRVIVHLNELRQGYAVKPNVRLLDDVGLRLRADASLYEEDEGVIINEFTPLIIDIVKSDNTTGATKNKVIALLDPILDHYSFDQILDKFTMQVLIEALHTDKDELRMLVCHVLARADPSDIVANTSIILTLARILADSDSSVGLVNAAESSLLALAAGGELVRRRIQSSEIMATLESMKNDPEVAPRLFDLLAGLLAIIPTLPEDLYKVSLKEFEATDDVLLNSLQLSFYVNLLQHVRMDDRLRFIIPKLGDQIDYITRVYLEDKFKPDLKSFFNFESVIFLSQLTYAAPDSFAREDAKFHILDYAIDHAADHDESTYLLSNIDPKFLESKTEFLDKFQLNADTSSIYRNMVRNDTLVDKLSTTSGQISALDTFTFLEVLEALSSTSTGTEKLASEWSPLLTKLLGISDIANQEIWEKKLSVLDNLNNHKDHSGIWAPKVAAAYSRMRNGKTIQPEATVMDASI